MALAQEINDHGTLVHELLVELDADMARCQAELIAGTLPASTSGLTWRSDGMRAWRTSSTAAAMRPTSSASPPP